jgi:hypothetical protein
MTEIVNTGSDQLPEEPRIVLKKAAQQYLQVWREHHDDAVAIMDAHNHFCDVFQSPAIEAMIKNWSVEQHKDARLGIIMTIDPSQLMEATLLRVSMFAEM